MMRAKVRSLKEFINIKSDIIVRAEIDCYNSEFVLELFKSERIEDNIDICYRKEKKFKVPKKFYMSCKFGLPMFETKGTKLKKIRGWFKRVVSQEIEKFEEEYYRKKKEFLS